MDFDDADNSSSLTPFRSFKTQLDEIGYNASKNTSLELFNFNLSQAVLILQEHMSDHVFEGMYSLYVAYVCHC